MSYQDEFYTPDKVDEQIQRVSQHKAGDQADAEALAYLRNMYRANAQQEREALGRMWNRIAGAASSASSTQNESARGIVLPVQRTQQPQTYYNNQPPRKPRASFAQRLGLLAAAVFLVLLVGSMAIVFYAVRHQPGTGAPTPAPTKVHTVVPTTPTTSITPTAASVPLHVTSVDMAVNPTSIAGIPCGTNVIVTYTATFHVAPGSAGGVVKFDYTINNGRGSTPASITFDKGQTSQTYSFKWSGALPIDHTMPEPGGVIVTSPNSYTSQRVGPTGACTSAAAFNVTSVSMSVSPASIAGMTCGTNVTVTYTATFHIAPGSSGGTIQFMYSINNGRGSTPASLTVAPGNTTATYSFTWSGALPADHTMPEPGGVIVTSPNSVSSGLFGPTGRCS